MNICDCYVVTGRGKCEFVRQLVYYSILPHMQLTFSDVNFIHEEKVVTYFSTPHCYNCVCMW
jgi:hypothetical protein